jgi:hypothetical protein
MIRYIYEIVCRFTLSFDVAFKNRQQLAVYVTSMVGEVGNWRITDIPMEVERGCSVILTDEQTLWAEELDQRWIAAGNRPRKSPDDDDDE